MHLAILALVRAGHQVVPASPIFGGLWHIDRGPHLTAAQLIARARETGFLEDDDWATESRSPDS
ncbi:hypothetical protein [Methylobacterium brachythecii]|uniref:O-acetylhomoserine/O-acetylserine sulfhydrylase-like pyridoxal-dependent enzyme n=1 Tax=Methylobacterium brachythecii TaxID=1176177 RepID=A0A7W6F5I2_9HYPH|nr:hypothetical protein [Methylobacterium brachythecii]MBB3901400.1 O-acetylhomoserine/O-acetylserine sulfhydrylase-like pyridoxal-dependent enzyme [Methylobacterium brachythecii]GLS42974.1 hypothetical protein GCM10007884_09590 [Methylobacterium brachythecii]